MTQCRDVGEIAVTDAKRMLDSGEAVLIDVRDPSEYAREHVLGARLAPLAGFDTHDFDRERASGKAVIFHCQSGNRTAMQVEALMRSGFPTAYRLKGGLNAWREAGLPTHLDRSQPIDIMRQVQMTAGGLVVAGALLSAIVSPNFLLLAGGVGAGLMYAGLSGNCTMAAILRRMPWNQTRMSADATAAL